MGISRTSRRRGLALLAAGGLGAGLIATVGVSPADAAAVKLEYTCTYPLIAQQDLSVDIQVDMPTEVDAGKPTGAFNIKAIATISANTTSGLTMIGGKTIEGKAISHVNVQAPSVNLPDVQVPVSVAKTNIPASGAFDTVATGATPSLTFPTAGTGTIDIGNLDMNIIVKDGTGKPVMLPGSAEDGSFDAPCTPKAGQNQRLTSFKINGTTTNHPPVAQDGSTTVAKDGTVQVPLKATDADGDALTYTVSTPGHGTATVSGSTATYKPAAGYTGADSFDFTANDGKGGTDSGTISVTVEGGGSTNQPPVAQDTSATVDKDGTVQVPLKATDADGDALTFTVSTPGHGTATVSGSTATYKPAAGYTGADSFTFTADDGKGGKATGNVGVTVKDGSTPGGVKYDLALKGSSFIKGPNGTVPLNGSIAANLDLATGNYTADLVLANTAGNFKIMGFLPVTSTVAFEQVGKTTGSLKGGHLVANAKMYVKLPSVTTFGFPLGGGANCKTVTPAEIKLDSTKDPFNPLAGGPIGSTYTLPALNDQCGDFGSIISMFVAGSGNTITANLAPKA